MHQEDDADFCKPARKKISKDHPDLNENMERLSRLLGLQFCPYSFETPLQDYKSLHRITENEGYAVWKIDVVLRGLRMSQLPRYWFGVVLERELIVPLEMAMHKNYGEKENQIEHSALEKMKRYMRESQ